TRASVYLALNRGADAVQDLQTALAETQSALRYFHLALAHRAARQRQEAKEAMDVARALGLDPSALHPLERSAYKALCVDLGIKWPGVRAPGRGMGPMGPTPRPVTFPLRRGQRLFGGQVDPFTFVKQPRRPDELGKLTTLGGR